MKLAIAVKGPVIKYKGGGGWGINFFFKYWFSQWPTPELFEKIGAAYPWSGTEKTSDLPPNQTSNTDVDRYIRGHWLTTFVRTSKKSSRSKSL